MAGSGVFFVLSVTSSIAASMPRPLMSPTRGWSARALQPLHKALAGLAAIFQKPALVEAQNLERHRGTHWWAE